MRRFFNNLAGCVLLLFLSDLARAQSVDIQLRTAQGCIFLHPAGADVKSVDLAKLADHQCNQGRVNGGIFYGLGWTVARPQQQAEEFIGMRTGLMVNGQFDGLRMSFNQGGRVLLVNSATSAVLRTFERETPQYSLNALLAAIAELVPQTASRNPATNVTLMQAIARAWDSNPYGLMKEFTDPADQVTFQNPSWVGRTGSASTPAAGNNQIQRDDPKTTGRGARGG